MLTSCRNQDPLRTVADTNQMGILENGVVGRERRLALRVACPQVARHHTAGSEARTDRLKKLPGRQREGDRIVLESTANSQASKCDHHSSCRKRSVRLHYLT